MLSCWPGTYIRKWEILLFQFQINSILFVPMKIQYNYFTPINVQGIGWGETWGKPTTLQKKFNCSGDNENYSIIFIWRNNPFWCFEGLASFFLILVFLSKTATWEDQEKKERRGKKILGNNNLQRKGERQLDSKKWKVNNPGENTWENA